MISVTQILSPWINSGFYTSEGAERGSQVHARIATELLGLMPSPINPEYIGYVESAQKWLDRVKPEIFEIEPELKDEQLGYCGHPDLICFISGKICIPDWKTATTAAKWWPIQLAGYKNLVKTKYPTWSTFRIMTLQLRSDGQMATEKDYTNQLATAEAIFLSALNCHNYFKNQKEGEYEFRD